MKLTKVQVRYEVPAKGMDHCRDCQFYIISGHCKIVEGDIQPNGWCERFEDKVMAKKHHKFSHTHIEHHADGSHTVHHVHESDSSKDVKHATPDHDHLMDSMMDHTSAPNPGEASADMGDHGVPPAAAEAAGLPAPSPAGPAGPAGLMPSGA